MNINKDKLIEDLINFYVNKLPKDAEILRNAIIKGDAINMFNFLLEKYKKPSKTQSEKLLYGARLFYFIGFSINYNNGLPLIEIINDSIDTGSKEVIINAVNSQYTIIEFLAAKGLDINFFKDYAHRKDITEIAIDDKKKSTEILTKNIQFIEKNQPRKSTSEKRIHLVRNFKGIFVDDEKYNSVIRILIENNLINSKTLIWIDRKKGYKSLICALLKDLEAKNYLISDILCYETAKKVCDKSFKVNIESNKTFHSSSLSVNYIIIFPPVL
ncbi:MAG: hypothetical protein CVU12_09715 [Bacteroidetes bacterium HGW-Bacteroidetes-7]|jgi:hypothetical protein|nr:MAG: hypothetical protein CVU12_09715 [Bacteroidetes bacterium HGW-Bacteroidetes-7]